MSVDSEELFIIPYSLQDSNLFTLLPSPHHIAASPSLTDFNRIVTIARVLGQYLQLHNYTDQDFAELRYIHCRGFRELLRHIYIHHFQISGTIFIPIPHASFTYSLEKQPMELFSEKYRLAVEYNFYLGAENKEATPYPMSMDICPAPDTAIFVMQDYEPWVGMNETIYGGFFTHSDDIVANYYIPQGHFPSYTLLRNLKRIIITGARYCSFDEKLPWLNPLYEMFRYIYNEIPTCKILGICLGTQMLAKALGGETGRNPSGEFISYIETCTVTEEGREEIPELGNSYRVTESHGDCITKIPENGKIYAYSDSCAVELWGIPGRILGSQGHPEMTPLFVREFHGNVLYNNKAITLEAYQHIKKTYVKGSTDSEKLIEAFNNFLRK